MGITIRHLEGPLAGLEQRFDDSVEVISFGRSPECQVVYPPDCVEVGDRHFQLRRTKSGDYRVEFAPDHYLEINGFQADNNRLLRSGSFVKLGFDGPWFAVEIQSEFAADAELHVDSIYDLLPLPLEVDSFDDLPPPPIEGPLDTSVASLLERRSKVAAILAGISTVSFSSLSPSVPEFSLGSLSQSFPESRAREAAPTIAYRRASRRRGHWIQVTIAAIAAATAMALYLLFRREVALGAAIIGKFIHAILPPAPGLSAKSDLVDVSVFGPRALSTDHEALIQVFLHQLDQREIANALAKEADSDATRRGVQTLAAEITRGQRVEVILEGRGLDVDDAMQSLIWRGDPCVCQFTVTAPKDTTRSIFHPRALILIDSVPVGSVTFALKVTLGAVSQPETELRGDRARHYAYAFLSYASPDRAEVIKRAQGLRAGGTNFFNDLLSLEPGERWEQRLYQEIDRCDVFYLFWSSHAKASEWVMKETEYALARRASSGNGDPDIIPVIIEGPPPPIPPEALKDIHFNDCLLYVLAGIEGHATGVSGHH
jgi:hypothetical protein